jgi:Na+/proline symporter
MHLATLDWIIIAATFVLYLAIGLFVGKSAGKDYESYFLSGRTMPWWLLGTSMVATTFATDTPNLVAGIVRRDGACIVSCGLSPYALLAWHGRAINWQSRQRPVRRLTWQPNNPKRLVKP